MKCKVLHESGGRLRVHLCVAYMTLEQADVVVADVPCSGLGIIRKKPSDNDANSEDNHYLCLNSKTQICI